MGNLPSNGPEWATARIMGGCSSKHQAPVPLTLIDATFGLCQQLFDSPNTIAGDSEYAEVYGNTAVIMKISANWASMDKDQNQALIDKLTVILGQNISITTQSGFSLDTNHPETTTDGTILAGLLKVPVLNLELKVEGDTTSQNSCYVLRNRTVLMLNPTTQELTMDRCLHKREPRLPCLLLDVQPGTLTVRFSVIAPPCMFTEVLGSASLLGRLNSTAHKRLADLLYALRRAVTVLANRFEGIKPTSGRSHDDYVPYPVVRNLATLPYLNGYPLLATLDESGAPRYVVVRLTRLMQRHKLVFQASLDLKTPPIADSAASVSDTLGNYTCVVADSRPSFASLLSSASQPFVASRASCGSSPSFASAAGAGPKSSTAASSSSLSDAPSVPKACLNNTSSTGSTSKILIECSPLISWMRP
jgi:hypothetical protein